MYERVVGKREVRWRRRGFRRGGKGRGILPEENIDKGVPLDENVYPRDDETLRGRVMCRDNT